MRDVHLRSRIDRSTCSRSHLSLVFCECLQVIIPKGNTDLAYEISPMYRESLLCVRFLCDRLRKARLLIQSSRLRSAKVYGGSRSAVSARSGVCIRPLLPPLPPSSLDTPSKHRGQIPRLVSTGEGCFLRCQRMRFWHQAHSINTKCWRNVWNCSWSSRYFTCRWREEVILSSLGLFITAPLLCGLLHLQEVDETRTQGGHRGKTQQCGVCPSHVLPRRRHGSQGGV